MADKAYTQSLREFVEQRVMPQGDDIDARDVYPVELARELAVQGFSSITMPVEYGGGGREFSYAVALFEEVSVGSAALGVSLLTIFQAQTIIRLFGSETLKQRYLPQFAKGMLSSYAFAVPRDVPNLTVYEGRNSATFGLRNGPHMNLLLEDVRVPLDHLIGTEGKGVRQAVTTLDYSRTLAAAISIGIARAAFDAAYAHVACRVAFDQTVLGFQGIQWYFAEALADIDASRLLVFHAARALDTHDDIDRYGSEAKLRAAEVATRTASMAVQVCGAHGTMVNSPFGRYLRDAKTYEIAGGSAEILKNTIGKYLMRGAKGATNK